METNPVNDIQQCIQNCQQTAQQLRTFASQTTNPMVKMTLAEAAHHLDLCLVECQYSLQELQNSAIA